MMRERRIAACERTARIAALFATVALACLLSPSLAAAQAPAGTVAPPGESFSAGLAAVLPAAEAEGPATVNTPGSQAGTVGVPVSLPVTGTNLFSLTAEPLPAGLKLEEVTEKEWRIVGVPTTAGPTTVTLEAKSEAGEGPLATTFEWTIYEPATVNTPGNQVGRVGVAVNLLIEGTNMAALTAKGLPEGLTITRLSDTEGTITGIPTTAQAKIPVTLEAENAGHDVVSAHFDWTVAGLNNPGDQKSTVGVEVSLTLTGAELHTLTGEETLPHGLRLEDPEGSETEWKIVGTPTEAGTTSVKLEATNAAEEGAPPIAFYWTVNEPTPSAPQGPTASGTLAVSPRAVFSAAKATCGGVSWSPSTVVTQWLLDGAPISGATAGTFVPPRVDDGHQVACRQTATAAGGASSSLTSVSRTIHEQPAQPGWPIGPASGHCSAPVCMQEGSGPGATGEAYPRGGSWWGAQQVRCVSAPWTSAVGDSAQPAVRAFAEAHTIRIALQRMTAGGPVTVAGQELANLGSARDLLDGAGATPFAGTIVAPFGAQPFVAGELWSRQFPGAIGQPDWFAPGGGLLVYGVTGPAGTARSFQLTYTLTASELGTRLRCVAGAEDGPAAGATVASFASPEYAVSAGPLCGPRRIAGIAGPQPAIVQVGDPGCLGAPSSLSALGTGFQGVAVKGGKVALSLACGLTGGCSGPLSLLTLPHGHVAAVTLAKATVRVGRGSSRLVHLMLSAGGRRLLRVAGAGGLAASLQLVAHGHPRRLASVRLLAAG